MLNPILKHNQENLLHLQLTEVTLFQRSLDLKCTLLVCSSSLITTITLRHFGFHPRFLKLLKVTSSKDQHPPNLKATFASSDASASFDPGFSFLKTSFLGFLALFSHCFSLTVFSFTCPLNDYCPRETSSALFYKYPE